jgi:hypothetical protein
MAFPPPPAPPVFLDPCPERRWRGEFPGAPRRWACGLDQDPCDALEPRAPAQCPRGWTGPRPSPRLRSRRENG